MTSKYFHNFIVVLIYAAGCLAQVYKSNSPEIVAAAKPEIENHDFTTQTVYGFLDFTTTIGNTVMVFSPQSAPPEGGRGSGDKIPDNQTTIKTKPIAETKKNLEIQPSKSHQDNPQITSKQETKGSKVTVNSIGVEQNTLESSTGETKQVLVTEKVPTSSPSIHRTPKEIPGVKNNLAEPEYDFLSKQPTEVIDETYKLINLKPSTKALSKPRPTPRREKENPTGLVTMLGGTIVKDGLTTVHETSVIGTYINGKYAQVLQSSSRILSNPSGNPNLEGKIKPSSTQRILKTIGPQHGKLKPALLEPTPTIPQDESSLPLEDIYGTTPGSGGKTIRRHVTGTSLPRPKFRNKIPDDYDNSETNQQNSRTGKNRATTVRPSYKNRAPQTTTTTESAVTRRRTGFRPNNQAQSSTPLKPNNKSKNEQQSGVTNVVPKLKLPRTQGRWSYKSTPKPRIAIRKQIDDKDLRSATTESGISAESYPQLVSEENKAAMSPSIPSTPSTTNTGSSLPNIQRRIQESIPLNDEELDPSESEDVINVHENQQQSPQQSSPIAEQIVPVETLNVEISTAADLEDVYFEIATIKSPYSFQVGSLRNTRFITVTSTIKKSFATAEPSPSITPTEPLTENILANTGAAYESSLPLDSSVATLPAITLDPDQATPPLETLTETFSTTQTLLKTHLLPVISGNNTTRLTLVQTYNIARVVTATKTLPPVEIYQFIPSKTLNEFNSKLDEAGSELHLELDFGDDDNREDEDVQPKRIVVPGNNGDPNSDLESIKSVSPSKAKTELTITPSSALIEQQQPQLTPEQAQQLALLKYFGQPQPQVITTSRPIVVLETVYESHVIPILNNGNTIFSTLSRPVGTVPKTSYEFGTSTINPPILSPPIPQVPQVPLFPQQAQFTITTAPIVTQTLATISDSRVLKLTFGAKTAYTTLFSTKVVPTVLTTFVTSTIPVQATVQPFQGFYPSPVGYPPFPFVG